MLNSVDAGGQALGRIAVLHPHRFLGDDRPRVQSFVHEVTVTPVTLTP